MIPFMNEPFTSFSVPENCREMEKAIEQIRNKLGSETPLILGGKRIKTGRWITSINPSQKNEVIGLAASAGIAEAEEAIQQGLQAFTFWKKTKPESRARLLFKSAQLLRRRKFEFNTLLCLEAGKSWIEADADTAEAIDFLEYYGRQMLILAEGQPLVSLPGEDNWLRYIPLGVGIVIPPWNFPLAILVGMTAAAMVAGNTVVLKPASSTPVIAYRFVELLEDAGMPPGVVNVVTGPGGEIGDYLVDHPKTRFISFTGSKEVGLRIYERAAKVHPGQIWLKRVVAEMGGKDGIVVHEDADLEQAADAIVSSAFGFAGQKCSACSQAIVHEKVYDEVLSRVAEKTKGITIGEAIDPTTYLGPVIDEAAYQKIQSYIEIGRKEGELVCGGGTVGETGYFIQPTIFSEVNPDARIMKEEIFGPVVAFTRAKDFTQAMEIANNTEYGLTGAIFTKDRQLIEKARDEFHVGNLYFNRKCTGAMVGAHPFGGFNMSGTDSKAGGKDYLLLFTQAKLSSEKL
ncbi:MAG TPA: L-glutamate gamma-semialdehyde dehydrogenase [Paenibacillaceae bacterium]|nr:L-glutamate gamma-semialdehyde dehydrogenase [Paenibacillaceae bacterium]